MTEPLTRALEAARALSSEEQDTLVEQLLEWRSHAEHTDAPVWLSEEELVLVRKGREAAARGDTVDARAFLEELRAEG